MRLPVRFLQKQAGGLRRFHSSPLEIANAISGTKVPEILWISRGNDKRRQEYLFWAFVR